MRVKLRKRTYFLKLTSFELIPLPLLLKREGGFQGYFGLKFLCFQPRISPSLPNADKPQPKRMMGHGSGTGH
jgi:hypothetical protein